MEKLNKIIAIESVLLLGLIFFGLVWYSGQSVIQQPKSNYFYTIVNAVKIKINELGLPIVLERVNFARGDILDSQKIGDASKALSPEQICITKSAALSEFSSRGSRGRYLYYDGTTSGAYSAIVLCDRAGELKNDITDYGYGQKYGINLDVDCNLSQQFTRMCLIVIIPTNTNA